jgi:AraC-like DNA-binding protein
MTMQLQSTPQTSAVKAVLAKAATKELQEAGLSFRGRGEIISLDLDRTPQVASYAKGGLAAWQERRAKEILQAHIVGGIRIENVARQCSLSVSHFSHAFRASTGNTPHNWIIKRRVELATTLMRNPKTSLAQVAIESGFADQSHLTRVFKRETGFSPGAWRRSYST